MVAEANMDVDSSTATGDDNVNVVTSGCGNRGTGRTSDVAICNQGSLRGPVFGDREKG